MQPLPHKQPFFPHPLVVLAVAFAAGILAAHFFQVRLMTLFVYGGFVALLAAAALLTQKVAPISRTKGWAQNPAKQCALSCVATVSIVIAFILAGASLATIEKQLVRPDRLIVLSDRGVIDTGKTVTLTGVLDGPAETFPGGLYLRVHVENVRVENSNHAQAASGLVSLMAIIADKPAAERYRQLHLRYGTRIRVQTQLKRDDSYRNPGVAPFTEYLDRKGYDATGIIKSPLSIERLGDEPVCPLLAWLYGWRHRFEGQINLHFWPEAAGVLNASLLGNRHFLSRATSERFREGGTFHVLVISGWHISVIGGLVFLISRRFTRNRVWQFLLSTTILWCYVLAVGAEASVVRAALMFTLMTCAPVIGRRGASMNTLGAAALALLIWRPSSLFDPSFQLTFLSVMAIVVLAWPLLKRLSDIGAWRPTRETPHPPSCAAWVRSFAELLFWSDRNWREESAQLNYRYRLIKDPRAARLENFHFQRLLRYTLASAVVSFCVQLTLLPLFVVYFHRVSISSLILNVGVSCLIALLSLVAVIGLVVAQFSLTLAAPLITLSNYLNWMMVYSVDPFASLGLASIRVPEYSGWLSALYALYYAPLILFAVLLARWNPFKQFARAQRRDFSFTWLSALAQVIALGLIVFHPFSARRADGRLQVDFLDVGQGDAALVTMPNGTTLLIDGGGKWNLNRRGKDGFERDIRGIGEAVVSEYLWSRGLDRVDYVLATHMDADHVDGLNDVLRNFDVRSIITARMPRADPEFNKLYRTASEREVPIKLITTGDVLRVGDVSARVLWPRASRTLPSRNNDSIVLRLEFGKRKILFTGDVERAGEAALLATHGSKEYIGADIVKVPHHGSKTSSTQAFLRATSAQMAIFSVGRSSIFGHPHREVVERWQQSGAQVLTTGKSGMITVTTDGNDLIVDTFVGR